MKVVYVHGYGGRSYEHEHAAALRNTARDLCGGLAVATFPWESGRINSSAGREWREANAAAVVAAGRLAGEIRASPEETYIVGFSLGALVALEAVRTHGAAERVPGVILMGAAVPAAYDFANFAVPRHGVLNYYSPRIDTVLRRVFKAEEGSPAAGEVGFDAGFSGAGVMNLRVHKAHKMFTGYAQVARVAAQLIAYWEGLAVGGELRENAKEDDFRGGAFWDEVYRTGPYFIERWRVPGRFGGFRLVRREGAVTNRLATSSHLAPLMKELEQLARGPVFAGGAHG